MWLSARSVKTTEYSRRPFGSTPAVSKICMFSALFQYLFFGNATEPPFARDERCPRDPTLPEKREKRDIISPAGWSWNLPPASRACPERGGRSRPAVDADQTPGRSARSPLVLWRYTDRPAICAIPPGGT